MSTQLVFSLFDKKACVFGRPVFLEEGQTGLLLRDLGDMLQKGEDTVARHPSDFALYRLGKFDNVKGTWEVLAIPDHFCEVVSLMPVGHAAAPAAGAGLVDPTLM